MKYRGFIIEKVALAGADFDFDENGLMIKRTIKSDEWYYEVLDPMENGKTFCTELTMSEAKRAVDDLLVVLNMRDNTPKSWAKLG